MRLAFSKETPQLTWVLFWVPTWSSSPGWGSSHSVWISLVRWVCRAGHQLLGGGMAVARKCPPLQPRNELELPATICTPRVMPLGEYNPMSSSEAAGMGSNLQPADMDGPICHFEPSMGSPPCSWPSSNPQQRSLHMLWDWGITCAGHTEGAGGALLEPQPCTQRCRCTGQVGEQPGLSVPPRERSVWQGKVAPFHPAWISSFPAMISKRIPLVHLLPFFS